MLITEPILPVPANMVSAGVVIVPVFSTILPLTVSRLTDVVPVMPALRVSRPVGVRMTVPPLTAWATVKGPCDVTANSAALLDDDAFSVTVRVLVSFRKILPLVELAESVAALVLKLVPLVPKSPLTVVKMKLEAPAVPVTALPADRPEVFKANVPPAAEVGTTAMLAAAVS